MHRFVPTAAAAAATLGVLVIAAPPVLAGADTTTPETTAPEAAEPTAPPADTGVADTMTETTAVADTTAASDVAETAAPATVFDESGNPVATIALVSTETTWGDFEEDNAPDEGREYVRVVVSVASEITEGTYGVAVDDFILQDNNGFVTEAEVVASVEQAESDEEILESADLANGESAELTLTFQVVASVGPKSVYYRPEDDRLVDIADIG